MATTEKMLGKNIAVSVGDAAETIPVETRVELVGEDKWIVLSVAGSTMISGLAWNPAVYDDIVPAVDLIEE